MAEYTKTESMDWARENLRGQWTTLMTPFTPDDELDEEGLRSNICPCPRARQPRGWLYLGDG